MGTSLRLGPGGEQVTGSWSRQTVDRGGRYPVRRGRLAPGARRTEKRLGCKQLGKQSERRGSGRLVDLAQAFDETAIVHGSDLIQHDLSRLSFEAHRHTGRIAPSLRRHGGDDYRVDMMIHFVRRDDETRARFSDFAALGGIETDEEHVEAGRYHVQSFRSHVDGALVSASRS